MSGCFYLRIVRLKTGSGMSFLCDIGIDNSAAVLQNYTATMPGWILEPKIYTHKEINSFCDSQTAIKVSDLCNSVR